MIVANTSSCNFLQYLSQATCEPRCTSPKPITNFITLPSSGCPFSSRSGSGHLSPHLLRVSHMRMWPMDVLLHSLLRLACMQSALLALCTLPSTQHKPCQSHPSPTQFRADTDSAQLSRCSPSCCRCLPCIRVAEITSSCPGPRFALRWDVALLAWLAHELKQAALTSFY